MGDGIINGWIMCSYQPLVVGVIIWQNWRFASQWAEKVPSGWKFFITTHVVLIDCCWPTPMMMGTLRSVLFTFWMLLEHDWNIVIRHDSNTWYITCYIVYSLTSRNDSDPQNFMEKIQLEIRSTTISSSSRVMLTTLHRKVAGLKLHEAGGQPSSTPTISHHQPAIHQLWATKQLLSGGLKAI